MKLLFSVLTLAVSLYASADISDKATGQSFPSQVQFQHDGKDYNLDATGVATRKKFFVKVYSVASYLQGNADKSDVLLKILQDDNAKQLTLKFVHEAPVDKVQEGYRESFKNALTADQYKQMQKDIDTYVAFFNKDVQVGDEHILRWLPGGYVEVIINGNKAGTITNPEFAKGLWSIWFGPNSIVKRDDLISLTK